MGLNLKFITKIAGLLLLASGLILSSCSKKKQTQVEKSPPGLRVESFSYENPTREELNKAAPEQFQVQFETSRGSFVVEAHRSWSPYGVDRFYHLVRSGFFKEVRFFRVISGFMAQFGAHGNPAVARAWRKFPIPDEPVKQSNLRGFVTFAKSSMPNSRTTQLFINYGNNSRLDPSGFAPIGKVISGMEVVDHLYSGYGEGPPWGSGPDQSKIAAEGNQYLKREFPELDYIIDARIIKIEKKLPS